MFNRGTVARFGMDDAPCFKNGQDCPERAKNCHSKCERFLTWKNEREKRKAAYFEQQEKEHAFVERHIHKMEKLGINRHGHKVK